MKMVCFLIFVLLLLGVWAVRSTHSADVPALPLVSEVRDRISAWVGVENWTPERIAADPSGYARYAQKRGEDLTADFEANLQTIRKQIQNLGSLSQENAQALKNAQAELVSLCTAYSHARESNSWPVCIAGVSCDEAALKRSIGRVKWRIDQREQLEVRIQQQREQKAAQAEKLEMKLSDVKFNQIELAGRTEGIRVQETLQSLEQLEDDVRAVAETGTEPLVHKAMEEGETKLTDEQLNDLLATNASVPTTSVSAAVPNATSFEAAPTLYPVAETVSRTTTTRATEAAGGEVSSVRPLRRTLTPEQKAALGIIPDNSVPMRNLRRTQVPLQTPSRSDFRVPLLPPPPNSGYRKR